MSLHDLVPVPEEPGKIFIELDFGQIANSIILASHDDLSSLQSHILGVNIYISVAE